MERIPSGCLRRPAQGGREALEATGKQAFSDNKVVDVNIIDVEEVGGVLRPVRMRERIRAEGPSIDYAAGYAGLIASGSAVA